MRAVEHILLREIAGESVLIPTGEAALRLHGMIGLSESGALLWKRLRQETTREELVELMLATYEVDEPTAAADVDAFLNQMRQLAILEE